MIQVQQAPEPELPSDIREKVHATINRLKLNDYECLKLREEYAEDFYSGDISLDRLRRRAPFLAGEIERETKRS